MTMQLYFDNDFLRLCLSSATIRKTVGCLKQSGGGSQFNKEILFFVLQEKLSGIFKNEFTKKKKKKIPLI